LSGSDQQNLMEVTGRSAESLEIMARALHVKNAELQPTLEAIASTAVTMLSPAQHAALTVLARGELIPRASTGEPPLLLDRLQQRLGDGPCVNAAKRQSVFRIDDTREDLRWPEFCAEAARLNVRSMLCVPLWIDERGPGALSLYADQAAAFSVLSRVSQAENIKLAEVARRFVETGDLPSVPSPETADAMP
jgi:putative methionine-R-sulfoxide reductase with GAF domain